MNTQPAREASSPPASHPTSAPQVRTLLLTDLCESTTLVERLGDSLAAALFREHDRLVLELQQRWRGRLIDRSDGLLLLFERPIDGLGFALDYMRGLHELGQARKLKLQARAGLHVGEVLTWENTDEAVRAGAKSLEVEGLAKPLAARLMSLARPGQILLSAVAEPMSHRAASELGERGQHLVWKSYGRWRFKGVPNAQEIHEVGEPGLAALRMPKHTPKAWRDIPLWRRPAALAAEVLLIAGLGTGAWFLTRSPPAIAFSERDWVVVGDLRNLTGQPVLDESLQQAFRISLEQSRYVNVLSDLKVRDTLALMKKPADTPLDRVVASEIAIRDGARAVIQPTVAEVGGRVRVSAEVIDPQTQTTVYAESADGVGALSTLNSIDEVTGELREKLGEAISSIERDSTPLPQVSTSNLDALKAYTLGLKAHFAFEPKEALGYFDRAVELDPNFALAYLSAGRTYGRIGDVPGIRRKFDKANQHRAHLATRELLTLDAQIARFGPVEPMLQRWEQLIEMYPDNHDAHLVLAVELMLRANQFEAGLNHAKEAAAPQYIGRDNALNLQGILLTGLDRLDEAIKAFEGAYKFGYKGVAYEYARAYAAKRDYDGARRVLTGKGHTGTSVGDLRVPLQALLMSVDRGQWKSAEAEALGGVKVATHEEPVFAGAEWRVHVLSVAVLARQDSIQSLERRLLQELGSVRANAERTDGVSANYSKVLSLSLGYLGANIDSLAVVQRALEYTSKSTDTAGYPLLVQLREALLAEQERLSGKPELATGRLSAIAQSDSTLVVVHAALARAARDAGQFQLALREAQWLAKHRGRAYTEWGAEGILTPFNVAETTLARLQVAELLSQLGKKEESQKELEAFIAAWPDKQLPEYLRKRVDRAKRQSA